MTMAKQKQLFYAPVKKLMDGDNKYSRAIKIPQYEPSQIKPRIEELCNKVKYTELMASINASTVPDDVKEFLRLGATRHLVFNYSKIADYYAHADADVQRLMEQSALVILDIDDAIANGYVKLSKRMEELVEEAKLRSSKENRDELE